MAHGRAYASRREKSDKNALDWLPMVKGGSLKDCFLTPLSWHITETKPHGSFSMVKNEPFSVHFRARLNDLDQEANDSRRFLRAL